MNLLFLLKKNRKSHEVTYTRTSNVAYIWPYPVSLSLNGSGAKYFLEMTCCNWEIECTCKYKDWDVSKWQKLYFSWISRIKCVYYHYLHKEKKIVHFPERVFESSGMYKWAKYIVKLF